MQKESRWCFKYKAVSNPHDSFQIFSAGVLPGQVADATGLLLSND